MSSAGADADSRADHPYATDQAGNKADAQSEQDAPGDLSPSSCVPDHDHSGNGGINSSALPYLDSGIDLSISAL